MPSLYNFENGLRLSVTERHEAPVVSLYLWFEVGSANETEGLFGAAHMVEHMLFKGSSQHGIGSAASTIEGLGGDINAYTSFDQTVLHATVVAEHWAEALDVLLDMATSPVFDPEEFELEKQVILEEVRGALGEPDYLVDLEIQDALFPSHGYGRPILGTEESVTRMKRDELFQFWRDNYVPQRAVLAISGPLDRESVNRQVSEKVQKWHGANEGAVRLPPPPGQLPFIGQISGAFATRTVQMGWSVPPADHPDAAALDILVSALGQGRASILNEILELEQGIAHDVWSYLLPRSGPSVISLGFMPNKNEGFHCLELVFKEVRRVIRTGLSQEEFQRTQHSVLADFLFGEETVDGVTHDNAWYTARFGCAEAREEYRTRLGKVTIAAAQKVAEKYLQPHLCALSFLADDLKFDDVASLTQQSEEAIYTEETSTNLLVKPLFRRPSASLKQPQRIVLDNGVTLLLNPDPSPVAAFRFITVGGGLTEQPATAGTTSAWSQMMLSGAGQRDATEFARTVERFAGEIYGVGGRNTIGISGSFPSEYLLEGLQLSYDLLHRPAFDHKQWTYTHEEFREHLLTLEDRPSEMAARALNKHLWTGHPWSQPSTGRLTTIRQINPKKLRAFHNAHFHPDNLVVAVSGCFDREAILASLAQNLVLPTNPLFPLKRAPLQPINSGHWRLKGGHEQSSIMIGFRAHRVDQPERFVLDLASAILGGQGGRLFMELREKRSLAYSVYANSVHGLDGGQFVAGIATEPKRATEAYERLQHEIYRLAQTPPSPEELNRNRYMLKGHAAIELQRASERAAEAAIGERLGIHWGFDSYCHALDKVTPEQISAVLCSIIEAGSVIVQVDPKAE